MGTYWQTAFVGHLSEETLASALGTCPKDVAQVVFDCTSMTGYDLSSRHAFVKWNKELATLERVAIVTENTLWHMVVGAMSLASGKPMRCFGSLDDARAWVGGT